MLPLKSMSVLAGQLEVGPPSCVCVPPYRYRHTRQPTAAVAVVLGLAKDEWSSQHPSGVLETQPGWSGERRGLSQEPSRAAQHDPWPDLKHHRCSSSVSLRAGTKQGSHLLCCLVAYRDKHTGYPLLGITVVLGLRKKEWPT